MDQFGNAQPIANTAPQVTSVISPQYTGPQGNGGSRRNLVKVLFIVIGLLIVGEIAWAAYTLTRPLPSAPEGATVSKQTVAASPIASASLFFQGPASATVGATIKVDVMLDSSEPTDGTDALIKYDPTVLSAQTPTTGSIYQEYPAKSVDAQKGIIALSGLTSQSATGFAGKGVLGTLTFKTLKAGQTTISIDYTQGATTESNVIGSTMSKDILTGTEPLIITIK